MVSGYCVICQFPATHKCKLCGAKLCNRHAGEHICPEKEFEPVVQKVPGPAAVEAPAKREYTKRGGKK